MGHGFGNLWKYYGVISYRISPFEQKPLKGVLNPGFLNTCRRIAENVPYMGPRKLQTIKFSIVMNIQFIFCAYCSNSFPFSTALAALISYLVYEWAEHENHKSHRKNPADYANDV